MVRTLLDHATGQQVTLLGTAHLSEASIQQVRAVLADVQPDVIVVELDEARLERFGIGMEDLRENPETLQVITVEDIQPPLMAEEVNYVQPWFQPLQDVFLNIFTTVVRKLLTNMYDDMGASMGGLKGGGEFLEAIDAARTNPKCQRLVLGDRNSMATIRRAAELALRSGNPLEVLDRLSSVSQEEMGQLEDEVRERESMEGASDGDIQVAVVEALKEDPHMRQRLFERLEVEVPAFARALLTERDYIMAEAIRRETCQGAVHVVAVVGAAHVPGMAKNLRSWNGKSSSS